MIFSSLSVMLVVGFFFFLIDALFQIKYVLFYSYFSEIFLKNHELMLNSVIRFSLVHWYHPMILFISLLTL